MSVSEIGLAAESVPATVRKLQAALDLSIFRGSAGDDFAALGDDEGLLIVVSAGCTWFPDTGRAAELLPVQVDLTGGSGPHRLSGPPYEVRAAARA